MHASYDWYAKYAIRYDMDLVGHKVLNLTDPVVAKQWGFVSKTSNLVDCHEIASRAIDAGYDVIKVDSYRDTGTNYIIYDHFDEILTPIMVMPIE